MKLENSGPCQSGSINGEPFNLTASTSRDYAIKSHINSYPFRLKFTHNVHFINLINEKYIK